MSRKNGKPVRSFVTAALLGLAGAAAWTLLTAGQAGALVNADQNADTVNIGGGVANTGGNVAVGNASNNNARANQTATATGADGDKVASNVSTTSNTSNGSANIVTGDAHAEGNKASNNTVQVIDADGSGGLVNADQNATNTNIGIAVANTGGNIAVGNASQNNANANQTATATGTGGDKIASNIADATNHSDGSATIVTGDANAVGNTSTNNTVQTLDAHSPGGLVLVDQNVNNLNFGVGFANTGLNIGIGNASVNNSSANQTSTATGPGGEDKAATNVVDGGSTSDGSVVIGTGNANAIGNIATNTNAQTLDASDVVSVRDTTSATMPLALLLLLSLLVVRTPARKLANRRR